MKKTRSFVKDFPDLGRLVSDSRGGKYYETKWFALECGISIPIFIFAILCGVDGLDDGAADAICGWEYAICCSGAGCYGQADTG